MPISEYSTTPSANTTINEIDIDEGCAPGGINDAIRQLMADIKLDRDGNTQVLNYLGSVDTTSALPQAGAAENEFYYVAGSDAHYVYADDEWVAMSETVNAWVICAEEEPTDSDELDALYGRLCDGGFIVFGRD